jgi:hypothetical protein
MKDKADAARKEWKAAAEDDKEKLMTKMNEERKAFIEWMKAKTKANQAETNAILAKTEATKAETKAIIEATKARREKRMEANTNDDRNESTACKDVMEVSTEKMEPNLEENEEVVERQRVHDDDTAIHLLKDDRNETTAYNEATEKMETDPGIMQSVEEHQDVPTEAVVVRAVKGLKKRHRGRKSTAERRGKPKKGTGGYSGSRRKVTVAGKRTSCHATVAWLKRKVFRRSGNQESYGRRKELAIAEIRTTRYAGVIRRRGRIAGKNQTTNNVGELTQKEHTEEKRCWNGPKCKLGIKDPGTNRKPRLKMERISDGFDRKAFGLQFVKRGPEVSSGLREVKNWALWRTRHSPDWEFRIWILWKDRPPPKRKKNLLVALTYEDS